VEQALVLIEGNYVHLPLKESMHGVDPVQKLRLIQHRIAQASTATMGSEYEFHRDMLEVFNSVRDLHTNYLLPAPFASTVAFMPFDIEEYFDQGEPHYLASNFVQGFNHEHFEPGVEITHWSGVPIRRAIEVIARRHAGSNPSARHARGVQGLTIRPLRLTLPPDELWVEIGYIDLDGVGHEMRQEWLVTPELPDDDAVDTDSINVQAACMGIDLNADIVRRTRKLLFAPGVVAQERRTRRKVSRRKAAAGESVPSTMPGIFSARSVETTAGEFGHVRIFTFNVDDPDAFVDEFIRLAGLLPGEGLIVDVRGNGGGHIFASEGLLQVLTPRPIEPEPVQFVNTPLNLRICHRHRDDPVGIDLGPWVDSIRGAIETGAIYSRGFPITPPEFANQRGQHYHGPAILVTDARCYSATDIFAAGWKDHDIGPILGVDDNTGAGGANVWTHDLLRQLLMLPSPADSQTPYRTLPNGAGMRVSIRRTLRVGTQAGTPLEDLGVKPDHRHLMTRDDLLQGNVDLLDRAAALLAAMPVRRLDVSLSDSGPELAVSASTRGITRLDTWVNDRPVDTRDVSGGDTSFTVSRPTGQLLVRLYGYSADRVVASRLLHH